MGELVELRRELVPAGPFRLPRRNGADGMLRRRGDVLERLLHHGQEPVLVRVAQPAADRVLIGAWAREHVAAEYGIERMRFALGVDEDLRPFLRRFSRDPMIGRSLRARPWLRPSRRPEPFEALAWAICEQLIEYERAAAIQRRIVARLGRRWPGADERDGRPADERARPLVDMPAVGDLAATAPALLQACDLAAGRALSLLRAAREVSRGRIDLHSPEHETGWRRLRAIPGIGSWTVEVMALNGQGRNDSLPASDLGLLKLAGRILSGGDPQAVAEERDVRRLFAPYEQWAGLAATHALVPG